MTDATWVLKAVSHDYFDGGNWNAIGSAPPAADDTGFFGTSIVTDISIGTVTQVGGWVFNPGASRYSFTITSAAGMQFAESGITVNGGGANINNGGVIDFYNNSTAGNAVIANSGSGLGSGLTFHDGSNAGNATVININQLSFTDDSLAGKANITN